MPPANRAPGLAGYLGGTGLLLTVLGLWAMRHTPPPEPLSHDHGPSEIRPATDPSEAPPPPAPPYWWPGVVALTAGVVAILGALYFRFRSPPAERRPKWYQQLDDEG